MVENLVEQLRTSLNEDTGAWSVAFCIKHNRENHYLIRKEFVIQKDPVYQKMEFRTMEAMLEIFPAHYMIGGWEDTNEQCGFDSIPDIEFIKAFARYYERITGKRIGVVDMDIYAG